MSFIPSGKSPQNLRENAERDDNETGRDLNIREEVKAEFSQPKPKKVKAQFKEPQDNMIWDLDWLQNLDDTTAIDFDQVMDIFKTNVIP